MIFDNGEMSLFQKPPGIQRDYSTPRRYSLDLDVFLATEQSGLSADEPVFTPFCGSVYEDALVNYLIDYAFINNLSSDTAYARLLGVNASGETIFYHQYPTVACSTAFNSIPLHLESTSFPTVGPQSLDVSTRGQVTSGDDTSIAGLMSGDIPERVALRVLGPSLDTANLIDVANPALALYDSSGQVIASNDNWRSDPASTELVFDGLAPADDLEAATIQTLDPGSYTIIASGGKASPGLGLIEAYVLSPSSSSRLANISTRGLVGEGDNALIGGFIVGDVASETAVVRALGPSLANAGVLDSLDNPSLTIYDKDGVPLATNYDWQDDPHASELAATTLAPSDPAEAALLLEIPAGSYTAIVRGENGATGIGLFEVYDHQTERNDAHRSAKQQHARHLTEPFLV